MESFSKYTYIWFHSLIIMSVRSIHISEYCSNFLFLLCNRGSQPVAILAHPEGFWQCLERFLIVTTWRGIMWGTLLARRGKRPGMMPNILQYTRQLRTTKNYLVPNVSSAEIEKPCVFVCYSCSNKLPQTGWLKTT